MSNMLEATRPALATHAAVKDMHRVPDRDGARAPGQRGHHAPADAVAPLPMPMYVPHPVLPPDAVGNAEQELWILLSHEEREFFADAGPGRLTYGPGRQSASVPAARGLRLDARA